MVTDTVFKTHEITQSDSVAPCVVDTPAEVLETLHDLLDAPSAVFIDYFFTSSFYPVRLLFGVAGFYEIQDVDNGWYASFNLSDAESNYKKVGTISWLCYILRVDVQETRSVLDEPHWCPKSCDYRYNWGLHNFCFWLLVPLMLHMLHPLEYRYLQQQLPLTQVWDVRTQSYSLLLQ